MATEPRKTIAEVAEELGRFPLDAFEFLQRGLDYTVQKIHGPADAPLQKLAEWMERHDIELADLESIVLEKEIPPPIEAAIEHFGGPDALRDKMNRHVCGEDLCWGLRDYALDQWGLMACTVLRSWGIKSTTEFGEMVFALVENGLLQKLPQDRLEDFKGVYDFDKAFSDAYKITISNPNSG